VKNKNLKVWIFLFLFVGIGNFLMMIDVLLSDREQVFSVLSFPASKLVSAAFYALVSCFLIYTGVHQNRKLKNQKKEN